MAVVTPNRQTYSPPILPIMGGLLDVATVIDVDSLWFDESEGIYQDLGCGVFTVRQDLCPADKTAKPTNSVVWPTGINAVGMYLIQCNPVGFDMDSAESDLRVRYTAGETIPIEMAVQPVLDAATAIPGGPVALDLAVGKLADHAARNYAGAATIVIPRWLAGRACNMQLVNGDGTTCLGNRIATTSGAAATSVTAYVIGPLVIYRTPLLVVQAHTPEQNTVLLLAERAYHIVVSCLVAKLDVAP